MPVCGAGLEDVTDFFPEIGVQGRQGLVQQQQVGFHHQGAGQGHALFFTAAQMNHAAVQQARKAQGRCTRKSNFFSAVQGLGLR
jgi:hypothetical protein